MRRILAISSLNAFLPLVALLASCAGTDKDAPDRHSAVAGPPVIAPTEGMWLYEQPPTERLRKQFSFEPSAEWLEHLQLSSVQLGGASGSFISPDGLIITNHHVALGGLHAISRPGKDYVKDGFLAASRDAEVKLPGSEARVLVSIDDVTHRVNEAVPATLSAEDAVKARNAIIAQIERESEAQTKLESRVVTLYGGALYHLYRAKRNDDVRIVFAPELQTAFFGGDADNFEYPRYCLDISILRAYEGGKPAKVDHWLKWGQKGVSNGDLTFVSGHPGRTDRLLPAAVLEGMRDEGMPLRREGLERRERVLLDYSKQSPEGARQAADELFGVQNSLKTVRPRLAMLRETDLIARKKREEAAVKNEIEKRSNLTPALKAFRTIEQTEREAARLDLRETMFEGGAGFSTRLFGYARTLYRLPAEDSKPDGDRLPEFNDARRAALRQRLFADNPVYPELEIAKLADSLAFMQLKLGARDPVVVRVLAGKSPFDRAGELVRGSKLGDAAERKVLADGGAAAIDGSADPMIRLVKDIDEESRRLRKEMESVVYEPQTQAMAEISKARFFVYGADTYPDATGSLRFSYGLVKGYTEGDKARAPWTTLGGAFAHELEKGAKPPYLLTDKWHAARASLSLDTPLDFVSTGDITGGNSGSPVVDRDGAFVGIVFDSNRQGVLNDFAYTDRESRMIAVDARGIVEAMRKIYGAEALVAEIWGVPR